MSDKLYDMVATQQTADLIMVEVAASAPCTVNMLRHWLVDQCTFEDEYLFAALEKLEAEGKIEIEDKIVDVI